MSTPARILMVEGDTVPPVPTAGQILFYAKTSGTFYSLNSAGVETPLTSNGVGTVTSVAATGTQGVSVSGSPITGAGTFSIGLGAITPSSVAASGLVTGSNLSGTNTGDQTISLTGDITGTGTGTFAATLATVNSNVGQFAVHTVNAKGLTTAAANLTGDITSSGATTTLATVNSNVGTFAVHTVNAKGLTTAASNLSGDITSSGAVTTLATVNANTGTFGSATQVPVFTVDAKGRITGVTNTAITAATAPATEVVYGTGTGLTSNSGFTYTSGSGTLTVGASTAATITSNASQTLKLASPVSVTLTTNSTDRLSIGSTGAFTISGSAGTSGQVLTSTGSSSSPTWQTITGTGTVTSVSGSGGTTGLTLSGGPITTTGTLTLGGTLAIANGGTGATTAAAAINALVPSQFGHTGEFLTTNGTTVSWAPVSGSGTVTSVAATGANGVSISGSPITTSGTITVGLGNITPTSVAATGTMSGSNLSGTNTGDQTITLTGDVSGTGTGSFVTTLSTVNANVGTFGSSTQVPVITTDAKGRITAVSNTTIAGAGSNSPEIVVFHYSSGSAGTFNIVDAIYSQTSGVTATITDGANCVVSYAFTGKSNPPKSILMYGQNATTNVFNIKDTTSTPNATIVGGGTASSPDLVNGIFSSSNTVTLQTRMSDVAASATLGIRAFCIVVFGF